MQISTRYLQSGQSAGIGKLYVVQNRRLIVFFLGIPQEPLNNISLKFSTFFTRNEEYPYLGKQIWI